MTTALQTAYTAWQEAETRRIRAMLDWLEWRISTDYYRETIRANGVAYRHYCDLRKRQAQ